MTRKLMNWVIVLVLLALVAWRYGFWDGGVIKTEGEPTEIEPTVKEAREVRFAVMADIHLNWSDMEKFLEKAGERGSEFVLVAGDMTSLGTRQETAKAKEMLERGGVSYYAVPGNHDLWWGEKNGENVFSEYFGREYQSFKTEDNKFILINNGSEKGLGREQFDWIKEELDECGDYYCVAVMHMPLNHNFSTYVMGEGNEEVSREAKNLLEILRNEGVKDIIAGHLHYSSSYEIDGIRTYLVGAVSRNRNTQAPRYTEFKIKSGILERQVIISENNDIGN
ncbi:MAG: metallophosphoesterase family protein [Patescibacteria group bacterium]|jgi:3',5'-cyclic AMP phosphodiesterase CpdA